MSVWKKSQPIIILQCSYFFIQIIDLIHQAQTFNPIIQAIVRKIIHTYYTHICFSLYAFLRGNRVETNQKPHLKLILNEPAHIMH